MRLPARQANCATPGSVSLRQNADNRRTTRLLGVVVVAVLVGLPAATSQVDKDKAVGRELQAMAGTWQEISRLRDGQMLAANQLGTFTQDERGNVETRSGERPGLKYSVRLDPTTSPKTIDYVVGAGTPREGGSASTAAPTRLGIYELDGDTLRICLARPGAPRPKDFASPPGDDLVLSVYRRERQ